MKCQRRRNAIVDRDGTKLRQPLGLAVESTQHLFAILVAEFETGDPLGLADHCSRHAGRVLGLRGKGTPKGSRGRSEARERREQMAAGGAVGGS